MFLRYVCRVFYTVFMFTFVLLLIVRLLDWLMQARYICNKTVTKFTIHYEISDCLVRRA